MITTKIPRIMIAGVGSGCGKTTVTAALLQAFTVMGEKVAPYKCGPDYIDPMFHKKITGTPSINLDSIFLTKEKLAAVFAWHQRGKTLALMEGVMGFYDGQADTTKGSAYEISKLTGTPVLLTVRPAGVGLSLAALVSGYQHFREDANIAGVILNDVRPAMYGYYKNIIEKETGLSVCGFLPPDPEVILKSRHLGLVTAAEVGHIDRVIERLGELAKAYLDLEKIREIAETAQAMSGEEAYAKNRSNHGASQRELKIAVAMDQAFSFYYEDNFLTLKANHIKIVPFSPMRDTALPKDISGLYIGGGYPELYAKTLSDNQAMRSQIRARIKEGIPVIAECGGYMYLASCFEDENGEVYPMTGAVSGRCYMTDRLGSFGYMQINGGEDTLLGEEAGYAHEFHYSVMAEEKGDLTITKGKKSHTGGVSTETMYAGYPHLYFYNRPQMMQRLYKAMADYHQKKTYGDERHE